MGLGLRLGFGLWSDFGQIKEVRNLISVVTGVSHNWLQNLKINQILCFIANLLMFFIIYSDIHFCTIL